MEIVIPSNIGVSIGDVIEIDGVCYDVVSETTGARTHETVDSVHQSCEICQNASSAQEESSSAELSYQYDSAENTVSPVYSYQYESAVNTVSPVYSYQYESAVNTVSPVYSYQYETAALP